jgi:hypothetical protein
MTIDFDLPIKLGFKLSRGETLAKLSANSLGFGIEAEEEMRAATDFRQAGGVKKSRHPPGD